MPGILGQNADIRNFAAMYSLSGGTYAVGNGVLAGAQFDTKVYDTGGLGITFGLGVTLTWFAPVAGFYESRIGLQTNSFSWAATSSLQISAWINGASEFSVLQYNAGASYVGRAKPTGSVLLSLNAGDRINYAVNGTLGSTLAIESNPVFNFITILRAPGPAQAQPASVPNASYNTTAAQSIANASTAIVNFDTKIWDGFALVTTGASWKFTANRAGKLTVGSMVTFASGVFTLNKQVQLFVYKNGSLFKTIDQLTIEATVTDPFSVSGSCDVSVLAGDFVDVRVAHGESAGRALTATAAENYIDVHYMDGF